MIYLAAVIFILMALGLNAWVTRRKLKAWRSLASVLRYDNETGEFYRVKPRPQDRGRPAGSIDNNGYRVISIKAKQFKAHRLAWLYVHGVEPTRMIDHIDGDRSNNRIENLREVTPFENAKNQRMRKDNTSGFTGVTWSKSAQKWRVCVKSEGVSHHLGYYIDKEAAVSARLAANIQYDYHENHGKK